MNIVLWIIQALLAALFLFAGVMKFVMSVEEMTKQIPLPGWFLHFIGIAEVLGAIGLVVPWLTGIRPGSDPARRRRAGDYYDRRDGLDIDDRRNCHGAAAFRDRDSLRFCRLRPLASEASPLTPAIVKKLQASERNLISGGSNEIPRQLSLWQNRLRG